MNMKIGVRHHAIPDQARCGGGRVEPLFAALVLPAVLLSSVGVSPGQALQPGFDQALIGSVDGRTRAWGVGVADFDGDDIPDIVSGDTFGDVHLFIGDGSGGFTNSGVVINQLYHDAYSLAAGDFDGDDNADFVLARTTDANEGQLHLYLGNGDGTFQITGLGPSPGLEQLGVQIGVAGLDPVGLAAADVDGDGDFDLVSGERVDTATPGDTADILLWRNQHAQGSTLSFVSEVLIEGVDRGYSPLAEEPPYYPPKVNLHGYGLALGDVTGDSLPDLLVGDTANYLYVYRNTGGGAFSPIRYNNISTGERPYAYGRLENIFSEGMPLTVADFNADGMGDIVSGNAGLTGDSAFSLGHQVKLWVNEGPDAESRPQFTGVGVIGTGGTDARGLAVGQLNPLVDSLPDVVFGNYEGDLYGLFPDLNDSDSDGIIDDVDNAPDHPNAPRIDMNTDGSINHLDQLDNDNDGVGDPADDDDDNDGVADDTDNAPFVANADQADTDGDGVGDVCDPLNDTDSDGDGVTDGPLDPGLLAHAMAAKGQWSRSDTHFIIRIDALGRLFQNEFIQAFVDAAILDSVEWDDLMFDNYNGLGDDPATTDYNVPADLVGGMECPVTVVVIPRLLWKSDPDPDPIAWINARIGNPNLEIAQHGTYHFNNTPLGDWASDPEKNVYSSESAGLTLEENYQLLRTGKRVLLGEYAEDKWIMHSGVDPASAWKIDWSLAANPLVGYAPPFNTGDTVSREATAMLGFRGWSASLAEESQEAWALGQYFSPEGSWMEMFDQFGVFHPSADLEVDPEVPGGFADYTEYLDSIVQTGGLNTWLIEEVEWSTRYCNDLPRLEPCPGPDPDDPPNRENNMVDPARWELWLTLLDYAKTNGEVMTMGNYALAMQFDNAPTVVNPDQADSDHDGIGDVIDDATLAVTEVQVEAPASGATVTLSAYLLNGGGSGIPGQMITFYIDTDGDGSEEMQTTVTGADGLATVTVTVSGGRGEMFVYRAAWDGGVVALEDGDIVRIGDPVALRIVDVDYEAGVDVELTVEGFDIRSTYRLVRSPDLSNFPDIVVSGFAPESWTGTLTDDSPPAGEAYYRVEEE